MVSLGSFKIDRFFVHKHAAVTSFAGEVDKYSFDSIYRNFHDKYSGSFEFSRSETDYFVDTTVLTIQGIISWNNSFAEFAKGMLPILREVLLLNSEHVYKLLDKLDVEFAELMPYPTEHFRVWLKNEFHWPEVGGNAMLEDNDDIVDMRNTLSKIERERIRSIADPLSRARALRELKKEKTKKVATSVETRTRFFREHFGGSRQHRCLYCMLNHACHCCGTAYPVSKFVEVDDLEQFRTQTKAGLERAGVWDWRCCGSMVQEVGLHLCNACGLSKMVHRNRKLVQHRKNVAKYTAATALPTNQIKACRMNKLRLKAQKPLYDKMPVRGGGYKGQYLQLRIEQGGIPAQEQSPDCTEPCVQQIFWGDVLLTERTPGTNGSKKSNGCSQINRKRLRNEKNFSKAMGDAFAEMDKEDETERQRLSKIEQKKMDDKSDYIREQSKEKFQEWSMTIGKTFNRTHTLQELLDDDGSPTEFDRASTAFRNGSLSKFRTALRADLTSFDTIEDYLRQKAENAADIAKYGKIINTDKIFDNIEKIASTVIAPVALMDGIELARKRMATTRDAYVKRQKRS